MQAELEALLVTLEAGVESADTLDTVEALRVDYLGKKGQLTALLKGVSRLPVDERPVVGQLANQVKQAMQSCIQSRVSVLADALLTQKLAAEKIDVTLAGRGLGLGSHHPLSQVRQRVVDIFQAMGFRVAEGPEIEDEAHNFEALNLPADHPARLEQDTFFLNSGYLLRTQTSPVQIRQMRQHGVPIRLVAPGRVYRRDSDQTHTPMFHQMEGLLIERDCHFGQLKSMLYDFLKRFFGDQVRIRFRPSFFPFTEPSAEVDIWHEGKDDWLEILGCGMVHPNVLTNVGVDPAIYGGFAFGMGLDRLTMLAYNIPDLRLLFTNDLQFLSQF